jgi:nitrogen fixation NifU-like protein
MGVKHLEFWQSRSLRYLEMAFRTNKRKKTKHCDGYAKKTGECRDTVEIFLTVHNGRIYSLSYDIDGCVNTNACCNAVADLGEGKTIEEAWGITPEDIANYLETLPPDHTHCAELVAGAFYLALADCREEKRDI